MRSCCPPARSPRAAVAACPAGSAGHSRRGSRSMAGCQHQEQSPCRSSRANAATACPTALPSAPQCQSHPIAGRPTTRDRSCRTWGPRHGLQPRRRASRRCRRVAPQTVGRVCDPEGIQATEAPVGELTAAATPVTAAGVAAPWKAAEIAASRVARNAAATALASLAEAAAEALVRSGRWCVGRWRSNLRGTRRHPRDDRTPR